MYMNHKRNQSKEMFMCKKTSILWCLSLFKFIPVFIEKFEAPRIASNMTQDFWIYRQIFPFSFLNGVGMGFIHILSIYSISGHKTKINE